MDSGRKRVCIIGSGASGLPSIKSCLEEGLEPVCFERSNDLGGLWRFTDQSTAKASVMKSTVINTSKEMMAFSDYPIPAEYPNFMHNTYVLEYFRSYAKHFDLIKHIKFNTEVVKIVRAEDYDVTGRWYVTLRKCQSEDSSEEVGSILEQTWTETFDAVMLCTGHHASPRKPHFAGIDRFKGTVIHSHDYKTDAPFHDRRVLIIGLGNSGGDAAVDLGRGRRAKRVFLSTRRGTWLLYRIGDGGMPFDLLVGRSLIGLASGSLGLGGGRGRLTTTKVDNSSHH